MGRIVIFTDDPGWHGKQLRLAFTRHGYQSEFVSLTTCRLQLNSVTLPIIIPGFELALPDAAFVRGIPGGTLQQVVFYLDILHSLKQIGIPVYNDAQAIERSVDKAMTSFLLKQAGLPTPSTWVLQNRSEALAVAEQELKQGHLLVNKPLFGSQGEGIRRIEKMTDLFWLTDSQGIFYLQHFIHCQGSGFSDIRVFVVQGKAIAAMRRCGVSWLNNIARGARCESIRLDDELKTLAVSATYTLAMDYAGVDIIQDREGNYTIIEVNSIPAWKGLEQVTQMTIANYLVDDVIDRYLTPSCCVAL